MQIKQIIEGWGNLVKDQFNVLHPDIKELAAKRLEFCDTCEIRKGNTCDPTKKIKDVATGEIVKGCGCNIAAKTLSLSSRCPASKW